MNDFRKLAILVGVLVCVATGTQAEAARIYNQTGFRIQLYETPVLSTGGLAVNPTNEVLYRHLYDDGKEPKVSPSSDSKDWTEENGTRSPSISWTGRKGVIIAKVVEFEKGGQPVAPFVFCPNSDNDFQGGNYLVVTYKDGYLVAEMFDSNQKKLWGHSTKMN